MLEADYAKAVAKAASMKEKAQKDSKYRFEAVEAQKQADTLKVESEAAREEAKKASELDKEREKALLKAQEETLEKER